MDEGFPGERFLELRAQFAHVDVDRALLFAERPAPDDCVELLTAHDPPAAAGQGGEQAELSNGEGDRPPMRERDELAGPDLEPALRQDFVRRCFHSERDFGLKGRKIRYPNVTLL